MTSVLRRPDFEKRSLSEIACDTNLTTYLDRLVRTTGNQTRARHVKRRTEYTCLRLE
jgi:hypothetical protein